MTAVYLVILFFAKVLDNTLGTAKTILVQRNRCVLAGVALGLSNFIYLSITKDIVCKRCWLLFSCRIKQQVFKRQDLCERHYVG